MSFSDFTLVERRNVDFIPGDMSWVPDIPGMIREIHAEITNWLRAHYRDERLRDEKIVLNLTASLDRACESGSLRAAADAAAHFVKTLSERWKL